jgi:adenylate kinase
MGRRVGAVLILEAPREELYTRLSSRATAEERADDTPEVIADRLDVYDEQTRPVISYYEDRGLVRRVNGVGRVEDVTARLREALE